MIREYASTVDVDMGAMVPNIGRTSLAANAARSRRSRSSPSASRTVRRSPGALISAVMVCACASVHPVHAQPTAEVQPSALEIGVLIARHGGALSEVWPGFWSAGQGFGLVDSAETVLYLPGVDGPQSFKRARLPEFWVRQGIPGDLRIARDAAADLRYRVGTMEVTVIRVMSAAQSIDDLFHEAYHVYQEQAFRPDVATAIPGPTVTLPSGDLPERDLLACALRAPTQDRAVRHAVAYIAARAVRAGSEADSIVRAEHHVERKEGSAQWVGMRALALTLGYSEDRFREELATLLGRRPPTSTMLLSADGLPMVRRQTLYATGAALLEIVRWLEVVSWQQRIEAGEAPFALLVDALDARGVRSTVQADAGGAGNDACSATVQPPDVRR